jgi:hypothetical protein
MFCELTCRWLSIAALAACVAGCTAEAHNYIRFPSLTSPGPAAYQRAQAIQHDPYPLNDVAPEIVGGRPLSYQQSVTEPDRAKMIPQPVVAIQPSPPPGTTVLAPPVASSPFAVAPPQAGVPLRPAPSAVTSSFAPPAAPVTTTFAPAPPAVTAPYPATPAPMVVSPYPAAPTTSGAPTPIQPRAPY